MIKKNTFFKRCSSPRLFIGSAIYNVYFHKIKMFLFFPHSYKSNATRLSTLFRDSPKAPKELAADWLEYVIRHGGAQHLRSAALDLNLFQYLLLDVISVILVVLMTTTFIAIFCCKLCFRGFRSLCGRSKKLKSA